MFSAEFCFLRSVGLLGLGLVRLALGYELPSHLSRLREVKRMCGADRLRRVYYNLLWRVATPTGGGGGNCQHSSTHLAGISHRSREL